MSSLNKHMIIGRLGQDPEVRYTQNNVAVATMSIATSQVWKDDNGEKQEKTEWHRCVAWGRKAEICDKYLKKGSMVYVEGPVETQKYEDKEGVTRYSTNTKVIILQMLDTKNSNGTRPPHPADGSAPAKDSGKQQQPKGPQPVKKADEFDDDELPF